MVRSGVRRIVGRAAQCSLLRRTLDEVIVDGSRFVLLGGDAGSGKTTLVEAFAGELSDLRTDRRPQVIRGQCVPMGGEGLPYAPIVGALRDLISQHDRDQVLAWAGVGAPALGLLFPELGMPPAAGDSLRLQLFEATTLLLEAASQQAPLVLIIEDLHWADESTRHLLRFWARALTDAPVLIITTYRADELTRRHPLRPFLAEIGRLPATVRVELPYLDRAEVAELLEQLLDQPPSAVVVDLVFRRSEGIPYFVEELTRSASRGCIDMPDSLRDALLVRVQTLSEPAQRTLRYAAVGGNRIDHSLLEAVSAESADELEVGLRDAIDAAVLTVDDNGYAFRHALLREVVHEDLLPGQHARLHARFATILEQRPELLPTGTLALEIAHHWSAAHDVEKAFSWSIAAATSDSAAYHETLSMYERALELWDRVGDPVAIAGPRAMVLQRAALMAEDAGETERALALITASLEEDDPPATKADRVYRLIIKARFIANLMRPGTVEPLQEALALSDDSVPLNLQARVLDQLATRMILSGSVIDGVEVARRAVAMAAKTDSRSTQSNSHCTLGVGLTAIGQDAEGRAEFEQAGELAYGNTKTALRYFVNYSDALHLAGRSAEAVQVAMEGFDVARELGLQRSVGSMLAGNAAEPLMALGEWERAGAMIDRALELDPPIQHRSHLRLLRCWLSVWGGDLDAAEALLIEFRPVIFGDQPSPQYAAQAIRADADHALAVGDHDRAWADAVELLKHWDRYHTGYVFPALASGAAAARFLDQRDGVTTRSDQIVAALAKLRVGQLGVIWRPVIDAELADTADGWRTALTRLNEATAPMHLRPYAGLRLAQHLVNDRERAEAKLVLTTALDQAQNLGAGLLVTRLTTLGQRAGLTAPTVAPSGPVAALTPRELEVLELVAAGRSNGEIGNALFISTKTASVHVSNILAKLGVSGRGEAAALAHRAGLLAS